MTHNNKGFLLLEVMLSVLLVAGGLLAVTQSFSVSKKILFQSRELFRSALLLREKIFEFEHKSEIAEMTRNGSWPEEARDWSLRVTPLPDTELERVELEVFKSRKPGSGYSLETYLKKKKE